MINFFEIFNRFGWIGLIRLILAPVTTLFTTPVRLIQTLWASRVLASGRWGDYSHFTPHTAINSLFYWTRALNLYRFGRAGRSPYLGLGNYKLSRAFHYSLPSLYAYWIAGAPTVLFGMFGWWLSHLIWLKTVDNLSVLIVMGLTLISTTFYVNLSLQNYNVVGWIFFPLAIFGLMTGNWVVACVAWLGAQLGGITIVFLGTILSIIACFLNGSLMPAIAILPAGLILLSHFWPSFKHRDFFEITSSIAKAIGLSDQKAKYRRINSKKFGLRQVYFLLLYCQFALVFFLLYRDLPWFFIAGMLIFLINTSWFRFADEQSIFMLLFSLGVSITIFRFHPLLVISFWLLASPLPRLIGFPMKKRFIDSLPTLAPFNIRPLTQDLNAFLEPVQKGQRVLMAIDDPNNIYENIFDGQRVLLELPLYIAATKEIHFMPDWWGVFELNYEGAAHFWGREVDEVLTKAEEWRADFVVVYQNAGTALDAKWQKAGFEVLSKFYWSNYLELFGKSVGCHPVPNWWLLKV